MRLREQVPLNDAAHDSRRRVRWCVIEYAAHTAWVMRAIEWAARKFVNGESPDWSTSVPDPLGDATATNHNCEGRTLDDTLQELDEAVMSLAAFANGLRSEELTRTADYGGGLVLTTGAVLRHALHDAEHHVLDIRRGVARLLLAS